MASIDALLELPLRASSFLSTASLPVLLSVAVTALLGLVTFLYAFLYIVAPNPRPPRISEKTFTTVLPNGAVSEPEPLPSWMASWQVSKFPGQSKEGADGIEDPELFMSVVVPAYNEEERLGGMLEEAVAFLQREYGDAHGAQVEMQLPSMSSIRRNSHGPKSPSNGAVRQANGKPGATGWEIIIVSDGSTDKTVEKALEFAKEHQISQYPPSSPGPWSPKPTHSTHIPHGSVRVVQLEENRGKGGAVVHGMRHVRGQYVVFADADGASKFDDLGKLVEGCSKVEDKKGRGVAIGSRAHLVGSEAVVKRSKLRNFLMRSFHLLLRLLTPPATSRIKDTQCGFKLFSRQSLPYIVPYMHSEGWIFDVELLMLAESAGIPVAEIAIGWKEVKGSKLNVMWDSLGMAWGLAILRLSWGLGVYRSS